MGQERLLMSQKELQRYHAMEKVLEGLMSVREAAGSLGISERQAYRIKAMVFEEGPQGAMHHNRGRKPAITKRPEVLKEILKLYKGDYKGFNVSHFTEKLREEESIEVSRETVRKHLMKHKLIKMGRHVPKHRSRRERMPQSGVMLQHDTSTHDWLEGRGPSMNLIASIDDATSEVPFALFVEHDGSLSNMEVMKQTIRRKGAPLSYYVDGASHNRTHRKGGVHYRTKDGEDYKDTQIERALAELGINLIVAGSPQAKGRVERLFGTFQDRLISELRLKKICTMQEANRFLHDVFLPDHNRRFSVKPEKRGSSYRKLPARVNLDEIFCLKEERTVRADNTISYKGRALQIVSENGRKSYTRAKVQVQIWTDESIHVAYKGRQLAIVELPELPKRIIEKPKRFSLKEFIEKEVDVPQNTCHL